MLGEQLQHGRNHEKVKRACKPQIVTETKYYVDRKNVCSPRAFIRILAEDYSTAQRETSSERANGSRIVDISSSRRSLEAIHGRERENSKRAGACAV